jgi:adenine-specific DNA-methyltransferase
VFDGFSGSGRVSQVYARLGYEVYANDIAPYAQVFNTAFLLNKARPETYQPLIDHLNGLPPVDGWFTENYGGDGALAVSKDRGGLKKPWQQKNTRRLDAIREEIDQLDLDEIPRAVALTSLILALDQVDNTLGHYASYLNTWSPRSHRDLFLEVPALWVNEQQNRVLHSDVFDALREAPEGIAISYYDPPYGSRNEKMPPSRVRYASYYHIWTTICLNDKPLLFGKARRRDDSSDREAASVFEEFRRGESGRFIVIEAIEKLIRETRSPYIILSYSSGGRATAHELNDLLTAQGKLLEVEKIDHKKNVMAKMRWTNDWAQDMEEKNYEYLFLLEKY